MIKGFNKVNESECVIVTNHKYKSDMLMNRRKLWRVPLKISLEWEIEEKKFRENKASSKYESSHSVAKFLPLKATSWTFAGLSANQ